MKRTTVIAAVCVLALLVGAAIAHADITGLYYQEVEKDGRVYVFNTSEGYQSWQQSGEMGRSITLVGRAAGGRTLVGENETAIDLYLFKHDLPAYDRETPTPERPPFDVSWKDGKTTIQSKNAELKLSNRVQIRFTEEMPESGKDEGSFRIRRAKTKFEGWVYSKSLTYELQLNFADSTPLEDANVSYDFTQGKKLFVVKAGRFKVPFGQQELTSSGSQQFVDRSITSNEFAKGRDNGIQIGGSPGKLDWAFGVFNGAGRTASSNDNDEYQYNARAQYSILGDASKPSEVAFETVKGGTILAVGLGYESNDKSDSDPATDQTDRSIVEYYLVFKTGGLSALLDFYDASVDLESGPSLDQDGYVAQVGYLFPNQFEIAARLAQWDPSKRLSNDERTETGFAISKYWNKHSHKLQADYRQVEDETKSSTDDEIRLQYQIIF